jgi:hypothetical protein
MVLMRIPDRSRLPSLNLLDRRHCHLKGLRVNLVCKRYAVREVLDLRVTHIRALPAKWGDQVRQVVGVSERDSADSGIRRRLDPRFPRPR